VGSPSEERTRPFGPRLSREDDPKGWDRTSIATNSHPLHPWPRVTQADLILPSGDHLLKLAGDCVVFGTCMALLAFFPLWMMDVMANGAWANWVWGSMAAVAVVSGVTLFIAAPRSDRRYLEKL
jgi:hypothetical protein